MAQNQNLQAYTGEATENFSAFENFYSRHVFSFLVSFSMVILWKSDLTNKNSLFEKGQQITIMLRKLNGTFSRFRGITV